MDEMKLTQLLLTLRSRRERIAEIWCDIVISTGFGVCDADIVKTRFLTLLDQFTEMLLAPSFDETAARTIGVTLAELNYLQPEALGKTQTLLLQTLTADLPAEQVTALLPQMSRLLGAIALGFSQRQQQAMMTMQHHVQKALLAARDQAATTLHEIQHQLRLIINHFPIILFAFDRDGVLTMAEGRGIELLEQNMKLLIGQSVRDWQQTDPTTVSSIRRALAGETFSTQISLGPAVFEVHFAPSRNQQGQITGVIGLAIDATARVRADEETTWLHRQLDRRIEAERLSVAQELHDTMLQQLLGRNYLLQVVQQQPCTGSTPDYPICLPVTHAINETREDVLKMVATLQHLISRLRPAGLDDLGLVVALEGHLLRLKREGGLTMPRISFDLDPHGADVSPMTAIYLFRAAQEALDNALQHAQATHLHLQLRVEGDAVVLVVRDNGCGFMVPRRLSEFTRSSHFGLAEMAARIGLAHGTVSVQSQPGNGTEVIVWVPMNAELNGTGETPAHPCGPYPTPASSI